MGKRRRGDVRFQDRNAAAQIRHHDAGGIDFAVELDGEILGVAADRKGRVERSGRIDEKAGPGEVAMLIGAADLHYGFAGLLEDLLYLAADRSWWRARARASSASGVGVGLLGLRQGEAAGTSAKTKRNRKRHCREKKPAVRKTAAPSAA